MTDDAEISQPKQVPEIKTQTSRKTITPAESPVAIVPKKISIAAPEVLKKDSGALSEVGKSQKLNATASSGTKSITASRKSQKSDSKELSTKKSNVSVDGGRKSVSSGSGTGSANEDAGGDIKAASATSPAASPSPTPRKKRSQLVRRVDRSREIQPLQPMEISPALADRLEIARLKKLKEEGRRNSRRGSLSGLQSGKAGGLQSGKMGSPRGSPRSPRVGGKSNKSSPRSPRSARSGAGGSPRTAEQMRGLVGQKSQEGGALSRKSTQNMDGKSPSKAGSKHLTSQQTIGIQQQGAPGGAGTMSKALLDALADTESDFDELPAHYYNLDGINDDTIILMSWDEMRKAVQKEDLNFIKSADWNVRDVFGWSVLHFAADCGFIPAILLILDPDRERREKEAEKFGNVNRGGFSASLGMGSAQGSQPTGKQAEESSRPASPSAKGAKMTAFKDVPAVSPDSKGNTGAANASMKSTTGAASAKSQSQSMKQANQSMKGAGSTQSTATPAKVGSKDHLNNPHTLEEGLAMLEMGDRDMQTPLHVAAKGNQAEACKTLLAYRANLEARDVHNFTPLIGAAINGKDPETVRVLGGYASKEMVDAQDKSGRTAMHWATLHGHLGACKALISSGASLNLEDNYGLTPVAAAKDHHEQLIIIEEVHELNLNMLEGARKKNLEVVAECLQKGAQLDAQDEAGWSALMWAAVNAKIDILQLLIKKGASVYLKDRVGRTAAEYARQQGNRTEILDKLFECNKMLMLAAQTNKPVKEALELKAYVDFIPAEGIERWTPLFWAAFHGNYETVKLLVKSKASITRTDIRGEDARVVCLRGSASKKMFEVLCNEARGDQMLGLSLLTKTFTDETLLSVAVQHAKAECVNWLLLKNQDLMKIPTVLGVYPFIRACTMGADEVVQYFLEHFGDVHLWKSIDGSAVLPSRPRRADLVPNWEEALSPVRELSPAPPAISGISGGVSGESQKSPKKSPQKGLPPVVQDESRPGSKAKSSKSGPERKLSDSGIGLGIAAFDGQNSKTLAKTKPNQQGLQIQDLGTGDILLEENLYKVTKAELELIAKEKAEQQATVTPRQNNSKGTAAAGTSTATGTVPRIPSKTASKPNTLSAGGGGAGTVAARAIPPTAITSNIQKIAHNAIVTTTCAGYFVNISTGRHLFPMMESLETDQKQNRATAATRVDQQPIDSDVVNLRGEKISTCQLQSSLDTKFALELSKNAMIIPRGSVKGIGVASESVIFRYENGVLGQAPKGTVVPKNPEPQQQLGVDKMKSSAIGGASRAGAHEHIDASIISKQKSTAAAQRQSITQANITKQRSPRGEIQKAQLNAVVNPGGIVYFEQYVNPNLRTAIDSAGNRPALIQTDLLNDSNSEGENNFASEDDDFDVSDDDDYSSDEEDAMFGLKHEAGKLVNDLGDLKGKTRMMLADTVGKTIEGDVQNAGENFEALSAMDRGKMIEVLYKKTEKRITKKIKKRLNRKKRLRIEAGDTYIFVPNFLSLSKDLYVLKMLWKKLDRPQKNPDGSMFDVDQYLERRANLAMRSGMPNLAPSALMDNIITPRRMSLSPRGSVTGAESAAVPGGGGSKTVSNKRASLTAANLAMVDEDASMGSPTGGNFRASISKSKSNKRESVDMLSVASGAIGREVSGDDGVGSPREISKQMSVAAQTTEVNHDPQQQQPVRARLSINNSPVGPQQSVARQTSGSPDLERRQQEAKKHKLILEHYAVEVIRKLMRLFNKYQLHEKSREEFRKIRVEEELAGFVRLFSHQVFLFEEREHVGDSDSDRDRGRQNKFVGSADLSTFTGSLAPVRQTTGATVASAVSAAPSGTSLVPASPASNPSRQVTGATVATLSGTLNSNMKTAISSGDVVGIMSNSMGKSSSLRSRRSAKEDRRLQKKAQKRREKADKLDTNDSHRKDKNKLAATFNTMEFHGRDVFFDFTPLHLAVKAGSLRLLLMILHHPYEDQYKQQMLLTAPNLLRLAVFLNHWDIVKYIIKEDSVVRKLYERERVFHVFFENAYELAQELGRYDILELMTPLQESFFRRQTTKEVHEILHEQFICFIGGFPVGFWNGDFQKFVEGRIKRAMQNRVRRRNKQVAAIREREKLASMQTGQHRLKASACNSEDGGSVQGAVGRYDSIASGVSGLSSLGLDASATQGAMPVGHMSSVITVGTTGLDSQTMPTMGTLVQKQPTSPGKLAVPGDFASPIGKKSSGGLRTPRGKSPMGKSPSGSRMPSKTPTQRSGYAPSMLGSAASNKPLDPRDYRSMEAPNVLKAMAFESGIVEASGLIDTETDVMGWVRIWNPDVFADVLELHGEIVERYDGKADDSPESGGKYEIMGRPKFTNPDGRRLYCMACHNFRDVGNQLRKITIKKEKMEQKMREKDNLYGI